MPVEQFITCVFCLIDDLYISWVTQPLRKCGTPPKLSNSRAKNSSVYKSEAAYGYCALSTVFRDTLWLMQEAFLLQWRSLQPIDKRIRTRDTWHLTSCIARKLSGFTVGIYLNIQAGNEPTQFEGLITTWKLTHGVNNYFCFESSYVILISVDLK